MARDPIREFAFDPILDPFLGKKLSIWSEQFWNFSDYTIIHGSEVEITDPCTYCDADRRYLAVSEVVGGRESSKFSNSVGQEF